MTEAGEVRHLEWKYKGWNVANCAKGRLLYKKNLFLYYSTPVIGVLCYKA